MLGSGKRDSARDSALDGDGSGDDWYRLMVEAARDYAIVGLDQMGRVVSWNTGAEAMKGYRPEEIVGCHYSVFYPPEDVASGIPERQLSVASAVGRVEASGWRVRKDGSRFWADVVITALFDDRGVLRGFGKVTRDMTTSREVESLRAAATEELERRVEELASAREQLRDGATQYGLLFDRNPHSMVLYDRDTLQIVAVNDAMVRNYGYSRAELLAMTGLDLLIPEDIPRVRAYIAAHQEGTQPGRSPPGWHHRLKDGTVIDVETASDNVTVDGRECRLVLFTNVTDRNRAQLLQAEATARFETAFADAPIGMGLVGLDGRWLKVNRVLCELTGYREWQLLALAFHELAHPDDRDAHLEVVEQMLTGAVDRNTREERCLNASGVAIWIHVAMSLVRDNDGTALYFIVQIEDISERRGLQSELQRLAERDPLTGLWNRRRFQDELELQIHRCQRYGERAAILLFDLDGFKAVNDTLGHKAGDDLLKRIAHDLRNRLRATDAVGRLGGDEFAVLLTNVTPDQAVEFAQTIDLLVSAATVTLNTIQISVTASIGVGLLDAATTSGDNAIIEADDAMYRVKAQRTTPKRSEPNRTIPAGARDTTG